MNEITMTSQPAPNPRPRFGFLRAGAVLLVCLALGLSWLGQRVHARGEQLLQRFGEHMMRYAGAHHQSQPEEVLINGASFFLSTGTAAASVSEVLDQFHAKCQQKNGQLHAQWNALTKHKPSKLPSLLDGVFRTETSQVGVVACAEAADGPLPPELLLSRVKAVLASGDISKLGNLRYAYVDRSSEHESMFVAVWSEGPLNFRQMFPAQGDAPGFDPVGIPRAPGTRRVLATEPKTASAGLHVYSAQGRSAAQLMDFYASALPVAGFTLTTRQAHFVVAHDGKRTVTIAAQDDASTGQGLATIATQPD
jgi:hypothetical protein